MTLTLYSHPLSSYCWKVLIALYENGTPFDARMVNLGDPEAKAAFKTLWPTAKIPLLEDGKEIVPETSIMIEHIEQRHPGKVRLIPQDPHEQLSVRCGTAFSTSTSWRRCSASLPSSCARRRNGIWESLTNRSRGYEMVTT